MAHLSWNRLLLGCAAAGTMLLTGCTRDGRFQALSMWNESRLKPLEAHPGGEGSSSLPLPPGTIARGERAPTDPVVSGRDAGQKLVTTIPVEVTPALVTRGQERFNIYCAPCHSQVGDGAGLIVARGFPHPPDYALPRLRTAPVGHFYDVITNGYGVMYSYASRVQPEDRWAIAAYIRVLQASRPVEKVDRWEAERQQARDKVGITSPQRP